MLGGCVFGFWFVPTPFTTPFNLDGSFGSWILAVLGGAVIFTGIIASGFSLPNGRSPLGSLLLFETTSKLIVHGTLDLTTKARRIVESTELRYVSTLG